jgi:hypothetical protein
LHEKGGEVVSALPALGASPSFGRHKWAAGDCPFLALGLSIRHEVARTVEAGGHVPRAAAQFVASVNRGRGVFVARARQLVADAVRRLNATGSEADKMLVYWGVVDFVESPVGHDVRSMS